MNDRSDKSGQIGLLQDTKGNSGDKKRLGRSWGSAMARKVRQEQTREGSFFPIKMGQGMRLDFKDRDLYQIQKELPG